MDTPIVLVVAPENRADFINFYLTVKNFAQAGMDVPAAYVLSFLDLIVDDKKYVKSKNWKEAEICSQLAMDQLSKFKGYELKWKAERLNQPKTVIKNDTRTVLTALIYAYLLCRKDFGEIEKDNIIRFFYWSFEEFYKKKMTPTSRKSFTKYKQTVFAGILTASVGYKLTSKKSLTTKEVFQACKYAINKRKPDRFSYWLTGENQAEIFTS